MSDHYTKEPKETECTCKIGSKYPAENCRYHATVHGRMLIDAHNATKWLKKQIAIKLGK